MTSYPPIPDDDSDIVYKVNILSWDYVDRLCRDLRDELRDVGFDPDVVVGIARGGLQPAQTMAYLLDVDEVHSLQISRETDEDGEETRVLQYPLPETAVRGQQVLLVDDGTDTGETFEVAERHLNELDAETVRTAALNAPADPAYEPDHLLDRLKKWRLNVYPWNFVEHVGEMVNHVMLKSDADRLDRDAIYGLLERYHDLSRIDLQTVQPDRMSEVLDDLAHAGYVEQTGDDEWRLTDRGRHRWQ